MGLVVTTHFVKRRIDYDSTKVHVYYYFYHVDRPYCCHYVTENKGRDESATSLFRLPTALLRLNELLLRKNRRQTASSDERLWSGLAGTGH